MNNTIGIIALFVIVAIIAFSLVSCHSKKPENKANPMVYSDLRNMVFSTSPDSLGLKLKENEIWGIVMDFNVGENANATLVVLADGTTSLYFSNGGGAIGCGQHENVKKASEIYLEKSKSILIQLNKTNDFSSSLPSNFAKFYVFTASSKYCSKAINQDELINGNNSLSPLFIAANEVITQIRPYLKE